MREPRCRAGAQVRVGLCSIALASLLLLLPAGCSSAGGSGPYPTPDLSATLGATTDAASGSTTFRVWAPAAKEVQLLFYASWDAAAPGSQTAMAQDLTSGGAVDKSGWNGVWQVTVPGVASGQLYRYSINGALALDPYARSMGQFDSSRQQVGMGAVLGPLPAQPDDLATGQPTAWVPFTAPAGVVRREDAIVYEVHVRDYTIRDASVVHPPGTFKAFAERLGHIRDLGATHVQLLPVLAFYTGDESKRATVELVPSASGNNYNWGYDPQSWFSPDGMYSSDPTDPLLRVRELATLVNEAHRQGLGVVLDVVYNHTFNTGILNVLAPGYYYRGSNGSGTGNDTASEQKMMRKLIVDSIGYLTAQYHVDGFRFDLMGLIDSETMTQAHARASQLNPNVLFLGEGWRIPSVPGRDYLGNAIQPASQDWMSQTDDFAVFSDSYRDLLKGGGFGEGDNGNVGFLTSTSPFNPTSVNKTDLLRNLRGDATNFTANRPGACVQYTAAHDGLTLHDKISKVLQLDPDHAADRIGQVVRLAFVLMSTSQGLAFINGGCEMARSKRVPFVSGDNVTASNTPGVGYVYNSYNASDAVNGFDWATLLAPGSAGAATHAYVKGLYALRRSTDAFRLGSKQLASANVVGLDLSQRSAIAYKAVSPSGGGSFSVFVNADAVPVTLHTVDDLTQATVLVDDDEAGPAAVAAPSGFSALTATSVTLAPRTAVVFKR